MTESLVLRGDPSPLVDCVWLAEHLDDPGLRVVDVRWRSRFDNGRGDAGACGLLALRALGYARVRLHDGSCAEWSADPDLPAAVGRP